MDVNSIDEKYLRYIDIYTQPDNINSWDEKAIFEIVNSDSGFSSEQKQIFVKGIAAAYYLKNEFTNALVSTKVTASDCEKQFAKDMKRATRNAAIATVVSAFEPTLIGETVTVIYYYFAIKDAQEDYNDCMKQVE